MKHGFQNHLIALLDEPARIFAKNLGIMYIGADLYKTIRKEIDELA